MPTIVKEVTVVNELGLHVRPAGTLVKLANKFQSHITLEKDGDTIDAKSIMGVMMLGASKGSIIKVTVDGDDAEAAMEALVAVFNDGFGELGTMKESSGEKS